MQSPVSCHTTISLAVTQAKGLDGAAAAVRVSGLELGGLAGSLSAGERLPAEANCSTVNGMHCRHCTNPHLSQYGIRSKQGCQACSIYRALLMGCNSPCGPFVANSMSQRCKELQHSPCCSLLAKTLCCMTGSMLSINASVQLSYNTPSHIYDLPQGPSVMLQFGDIPTARLWV